MQHQSGIKVLNGMIILTRRMYLVYFLTSLAMAVSLWICLNTTLGAGSDFGRNIVRFFPWFYRFVDQFFLIAIIIHLFEAMYICRKFREREDFLLRERGEEYLDHLSG